MSVETITLYVYRNEIICQMAQLRLEDRLYIAFNSLTNVLFQLVGAWNYLIYKLWNTISRPTAGVHSISLDGQGVTHLLPQDPTGSTTWGLLTGLLILFPRFPSELHWRASRHLRAGPLAFLEWCLRQQQAWNSTRLAKIHTSASAYVKTQTEGQITSLGSRKTVNIALQHTTAVWQLLRKPHTQSVDLPST